MSTELLDAAVDTIIRSCERVSASLRTKSKVADDGLLKDVHLIGLIGKANTFKDSKVPYKYREGAIKKAVEAKRYDGADIYIGHTHDATDDVAQRNPKDKIGTIVDGSTKHKEGAGGFGDIQFNPHHPYFPAMRWWIDNCPDKIMMSHVAELRGNKQTNEVVEIGKVYSVDIVLDGNTTTGMFKEGVISERMATDEAQRKLSRIIDTAQTLLYNVMYPVSRYDSSGANKVLTDPEKALLMAPIAKDLVKELTAFAGTAKKESTMDLKDAKLEDIKKERADIVAAIEKDVLAKEATIKTKVDELVKDIPADKRSDSFLKLVRESVEAGKEDRAKEIVADRASLVKEAVTSDSNKTFTGNEGTKKKVEEPKKKTECSEDEVLAAFGKKK